MIKCSRIACKAGLGALGAAAGAGVVVGVANGCAADNALDRGIAALRSAHELSPVSAGEYEKVRLRGVIPFTIRQYAIAGLGNLCTMKVNLGLVQMITFVVSPFEKDMPLLSVDYIYFLGSRKGIVEAYDLPLNPEAEGYQQVLEGLQSVVDRYSFLEDEKSASEAWYDDLLVVKMHKVCNMAKEGQLHNLLEDVVACYAKCAEGLAPLSVENQKAKAAVIREYADNMVDNGGVSTDMFISSLGKDATRDFFRRVFFGCDSCAGDDAKPVSA